MPIPVQTFWNTKTEQLSGRQRRSTVSAAQTGYKKAGYDWAAIDSDIQSDLTATAFPGDVQFPTSAQGWMEIHFNGAYSAKRQIAEKNWDNSEPEFVLRMGTDCPHNAVGIIDPGKPWQVVYHNAFGQGANLRYGIWHGKTSRVEHVIEITEMPPGDSEYLEYNFYIESNDATAFVGENFDQRPWAGNAGDFADVLDVSVFLAKGSSHDTLRGATFGKPVCWWTNIDGTSTKKPVKVRVEILPDGVTVKGTKYIKRADIAEALVQGSPYRADVTLSPDANPETTCCDGYSRRNTTNEAWATLVAGAGTVSSSGLPNTGGFMLDGYQYATPDKWSTLERAWHGFDTSSIGAGQQIDSADVSAAKYIAYSSAVGAHVFDAELINIYDAVPATATDIVNTDHANFGSTSLATGKDWGTFRTAANGSYYTWTLTSAGRNSVDPEGLTQLGIAFECERDGVQPTWDGYFYLEHGAKLYYSEQSGTTYDPYLTVTHSAAASFGAWYAHNTNPGGW